MSLVTDHLVSLIAKQVDDHALVVWYDPEGQYRDVAISLALPKTTVARYEDSFFALRHQIDHLLNAFHAPRLLVYVPMSQPQCKNALVELEDAGVVMQPGQQPPTRNTRLSVVGRNALKPILGDESAAAIERDVEAGKLSLAELNSVADKGKGMRNVLSLILGTGNPPDVALAFLASDKHDADITKKTAAAELVLILDTAFEVSLPSGESLPALRDRFARHVLATDLIATLQGVVPAPLASLKSAIGPAARESCVALARTWRLRSDVRESYVVAANKVEQEIHLSKNDFGMEEIGDVETFLGVEKALLRRVEEGLLEQPTETLLTLAEAAKSRFWSAVMPSIQAHWALIAVAAQVLLEADRVAQALKKAPASALAVVKEYTEGDSPWCLLDTYHRRMEKRYNDFELDESSTRPFARWCARRNTVTWKSDRLWQNSSWSATGKPSCR